MRGKYLFPHTFTKKKAKKKNSLVKIEYFLELICLINSLEISKQIYFVSFTKLLKNV